MYICDFCTFKCFDFEKYLKHIRRHVNEDNFVLRCPSCPRKYTSVRYWREHLTSHDSYHYSGPTTSKSVEAVSYEATDESEEKSDLPVSVTEKTSEEKAETANDLVGEGVCL